MIIHDQQETQAFPTGEAALWARLFHYVSWRWPERDVVWAVEGPGVFIPPLKPATVTKVERWHDGAWDTDNITPSPGGIYLCMQSTYKVTANVGQTIVPADVQAAYDRLAGYMTDLDGNLPGSTSVHDGDFSVSRSANAAARALQYSGAADLLRPYR